MAAKSPEKYFQTYSIYGHNEKVAAAKVGGWVQKTDKEQPITHFYDDLKIDAIVDGKFDVLLENVNDSKLVPILFSHGLASSCSIYSAHLRELASHGYIVFAMDHQDRSCGYTEDQ